MIPAAVLLLALAMTGRAQPPPAGPALNEISVRDVTSNSAVIEWATDQAADSEVDYGLSTAYTNSASSSALETRHSLALSGLAPGTLYHYRVKSRGASGDRSITGDFTFTKALPSSAPPPPAPPPPVIPAAEEAAPLVVIMNPPSDALVSGAVTVSANATAGRGVASLQFLLDGGDLGAPMASGPYSFSWNTTYVPDGAHALAAVARDAAGRSATSPIVHVTVDNTPPVISEVSAAAVSADGAVILWTTNERADSQVEYGPMPAYGQATALNASRVVNRGVSLTGLAPGTLYYYRVKSRDAAGLLAVSWNNVFVTAGPTDGPAASAASGAAAASGDSAARAPQKILTPARADGINDRAVFGPEAREVTIVDLRGRQVFHESSAGPSIAWNCRDSAGNIVPSGVYIAKIVARSSRRLYQSFSVAK